MDSLLVKLQTHYAVFHYTDDAVFLDLLCKDRAHVSRFTSVRRERERPAAALLTLLDTYGGLWHRARKHLGSESHVAHVLLAQTEDRTVARSAVIQATLGAPFSRKERKALAILQLDRVELTQNPQILRAAYRHAARRAHPDHHGGSRAAHEAMLQVNRAYEMLQQWQPRVVTNRWFYTAGHGCWAKRFTQRPYGADKREW